MRDEKVFISSLQNENSAKNDISDVSVIKSPFQFSSELSFAPIAGGALKTFY